MTRLRKIGSDPGDLDMRLEAADRAVQDERQRFTESAAGRIQWNWYVARLAEDIAFERTRLVDSAGKRPRHGEPPPGAIVELFDQLRPRVLGLREINDEPSDAADPG
jgi:hypothetical protein